MSRKLTSGELRLMSLIADGVDIWEGWRRCSDPVYSLMKDMPTEMVQHRFFDNQVRLTSLGYAILEARAWLQ